MGDDTRKWEDEFIKAAKRRNKEEAERARIINDPEGFVNSIGRVDQRIARLKDYRARYKKRKKDLNRLKKIAATTVLAAMVYLTLYGKAALERKAGENYILDTFTSSDDRYDKISVADFSNGLSVAMTDKDTGETKYVSIDDAVNYIIKRANNEGMSEAESYIVVSSYLSELVAKQAFPSVTYEDVTNAQKSAYYKLELAKADGRGATR